jgi:hypothetical protein
MAIKKVVAKPKKRPAAKPKPSGGRHSGWDVIPGVTWDEHAGPWILTLLVVPGVALAVRTWVFHSWLGRGASVVGILAVGLALTFMLWAEAAARGAWTQARVGLTGVYCTFGLSGTLIWALDSTWLEILGFVGVAVSVWWTAANARPMLGRGDDHHDQGRDTLADELGLPGSTRVKFLPEESAGPRRAFAWIHRDATVAAVRDAAPLIGSKLGVPATGIRVVPDPNDSGRSKMYVTDRDVLSEPTAWPGPSAPGTSIGASPCVVGVREDATLLTIIRPGQEPDRKKKIPPRPNIHVVTAGINRSGKTEGALVELADVITRNDVAVLWSDTVKPDQTMRDFSPACARVGVDPAKTRVLVQAVIKSIKARARYLGMQNLRQWAPGCGLTYLIAHFEEFAAVAELLGDNARKVVAEAGSVGVSLTASQQRPSSYLMDTDMRAQFGGAWCYGMRNEVDAAMVLSDTTLDAGAAPQVWKNSKPGYCYLEVPHVPEEEWSMPARTFYLPGEVLRNHVADWAPRLADIDDVTKKAMGTLLDDLPTGLAYGKTIGWTETTDGLLVPPGGRAAEPARETVRVSARPWTETGTGDEDGTARETRRETEPETGDRDDETAARLELESAVEDVAHEVAAEYPMDPEMRPDVMAALAAGEPGTPLDGGDYPDGEDFELAIGVPGRPPTYPERVEALATILWQLVAGAIGEALADVPVGEEAGTPIPPTDVSTEDLVGEWYRVPGIQPGQRPALYRLLARLERAGQVEDLGRGGWRIHPGAPNWLRENLASAPDDDTDGDDDGPVLAGVL